MTGDTKVIIGVIIATAVLLIGAIGFLGNFGSGDSEADDRLVSVNIDVRDDGYNSLGNKNASVEIVEFSDFECPACAGAYPILKQVVSKYNQEVSLVYQHFPLTQHPFARPAAIAAEAAGKQNKFWEMHDALFVNQQELSDETIQRLAMEIGLDMDQFNQDAASEELRNKVLRDLAEGNRIGVNGTPSIYINGVLYEGLRSVDGLSQFIESFLASTSNLDLEVNEVESSGTDVLGKEDIGEVDEVGE